MRDLASIQADLALLEDWLDKYGYIIDLGKELPDVPPEILVPEHLVPGCTSKVWLQLHWQGERLQLAGTSDAMIVKGLLAVVFAAYQNQTAAGVAGVDLHAVFQELGLAQNLTPNRRQGFAAMVAKIQAFANP